MIYSLLVLTPPTAGITARTAAGFAQAALARGHSIQRVFFLGEGVLQGGMTAVFPQDEVNPLHDWLELSRLHGTELLLCVSSALRHGMLDAGEAQRHEKSVATVHPAFSIAGLGQLIDANAGSDRLITFAG